VVVIFLQYIGWCNPGRDLKFRASYVIHMCTISICIYIDIFIKSNLISICNNSIDPNLFVFSGLVLSATVNIFHYVCQPILGYSVF
jgi:hypothetical protein